MGLDCWSGRVKNDCVNVSVGCQKKTTEDIKDIDNTQTGTGDWVPSDTKGCTSPIFPEPFPRPHPDSQKDTDKARSLHFGLSSDASPIHGNTFIVIDLSVFVSSTLSLDDCRLMISVTSQTLPLCIISLGMRRLVKEGNGEGNHVIFRHDGHKRCGILWFFMIYALCYLFSFSLSMQIL